MISKEVEDLSNSIKQLDLTDTYRTHHPTKAEYTFFSSARAAYSRICSVTEQFSINLN